MELTKSLLLSKLPPYQDQWILIKENQEVKDIKKRIEVAHTKYAQYYDSIALYFDADTIEQICNNIYKFIQKNIRYVEEPKSKQTTSIVTGILYRGYGDCKHYALFTAGILSAIERLTGKKIDWVYCFASYQINPTPHHVFVIVFDKDKEFWIDPVPGSNYLTPTWMQNKQVKSKDMSLFENIAGVNTVKVGCGCNENNRIGFGIADITAAIDVIKNIFGHKPPSAAEKAAALQDVRQNYYPGPDACVTGKELLPVYVSPGKMNYSTPCINKCNYIKTSIEGMIRNVNEEHIPNNDIKYLEAYKIVIGEYQAAYQKYCGGDTYTPTTPGGGYLPASQNNSNYPSGGGGTFDNLLSAKNALPIAGAAGIGTYFLLSRKGKKPNYLIPIAAAGIAYFLISSKGGDNKSQLINWVNNSTDSVSSKTFAIDAFNSMSPAEIDAVHSFIFDYFLKGQQLPQSTTLSDKIKVISAKYNIFT